MEHWRRREQDGDFLEPLRAFKCSGMVKVSRHGNDELDVAIVMAESQVHGQVNNLGGMDSAKDPLIQFEF